MWNHTSQRSHHSELSSRVVPVHISWQHTDFWMMRPGSNRALVQAIKAGSGSLEEFLTTALSELCKVKPEGLDAVR